MVKWYHTGFWYRGLRFESLWASQGGLAHLGERLICIQEVAGSSPVSSTNWSLRLSVRTAVFHTAKRGSIPLGTTKGV